MSTNIDYWEKIIQNPIPAFRELFEAENNYLTTHIIKNSQVLDIGCGDGRNIKSILPITKNIIGIDNDPMAVRNCMEKLPLFPAVRILVADAIDLPFLDNSFDFVILMVTLGNFKEDKIRVLQEMKRVLKWGGKIIISVYSEDALNTRLEMYQQIDLPILRIEGTKVICDDSVGSIESEQFSEKEVAVLAKKSGLKIVDCVKVGDVALIFDMSQG